MKLNLDKCYIGQYLTLTTVSGTRYSGKVQSICEKTGSVTFNHPKGLEVIPGNHIEQILFFDKEKIAKAKEEKAERLKEEVE